MSSRILRLSSTDFSRSPEPFASLKATVRLKKHICVIGAGPAGLRVTKDLIEMGHTVSCFEKMPKLGGVFLKTYDNMRFVSSSLLSAWSDHSDGQEHSPTYWTADEYISYCETFAEKYDLLKHIYFCHEIEEVQKNVDTGKWNVMVQTPSTNVYGVPSLPSAFGYGSLQEVKPDMEENGGDSRSFPRELRRRSRRISKYKRCKALATGKALATDKALVTDKALEKATDKALALLRFSLQFDAIAVCSGANSEPVIPIFKGISEFKGEIIHSNDYMNPTRFAGKRVLIVGSGESAADIMNEVSKVALKTAIVIRGKHGHIIPRYQGNSNSVTDLNTNRCRYSNSYIFGDTIGYVTQWFKYIISKWIFCKKNELLRLTSTEFPRSPAPSATGRSNISSNKIIAKIAELNMAQKTSAFSKYGCKSSGFVEAIVLRDAELFRSDFELVENGVLFNSFDYVYGVPSENFGYRLRFPPNNEAGRVLENGTKFDCDTIIACTGYKSAFPFFDKYHPELSHAGMNPRLNYKQIFNIQYPGEVAFIGFVRPAFGSTTAIIELQSRLFSYVISGKGKLPSIEEQQRVVINDTKEWSSRFKYDTNRINSIVDYQIYCDSLAKIMGVMPNLIEIFFRNPYLWSKIMFGPLTTHQYRLWRKTEAIAEVFRGNSVDVVEGVVERTEALSGCKRSEKRWNSVGGSRRSCERSEQKCSESIKIIERQPYGDFLETVITGTFLIITKIITLFWSDM